MSVHFSALQCGYGPLPVITDAHGSLARGDCVAVTGANGAGKSTLLQTLAGRLHPLDGRIQLGGLSMGYLAQSLELNPDVPVRVLDFARMGLWGELGPWRRPDRAQQQRVLEALETVGLGALGARRLNTLSGGQKQRLAFARLMIEAPDVLLLDEPFAGVDEETQAELLSVIERLALEGRIVVAALHDPAAIRLFPRRLHLEGGRARWIDTADADQQPALRVIAGGASQS